MKFGSSSYELIPIDSYEEMHEKFGGRLTGDGSSDKYAGGGGTAWCHTNSKGTYNDWTHDGGKFFVLARKNFKDIPFNPETNAEMEGKDDYGNSLLALLISNTGKLKNATLRCNHVGVHSNADNQYKTYAELSKIVGFNVEDEVKKYIKYKSPIKNGVYYYKGGHIDLEGEEDNIIKVIIAEGVTEIAPEAFFNCANIESVTIPDSVIKIGYSAFAYCRSLKSVVLPKNLSIIDTESFYSCASLTNLMIPDSVTTLRYSSFRDCISLKSVIIPSSVVRIGNDAFEDCVSLTDVTISNGVSGVGENAFRGCGFRSIELPETITTIEERAFALSKIESISLPSNLYKISNGTFFRCEYLKSVIISNGTTCIGNYTFEGCSNLKSVTIPKSVTNIQSTAFHDCPKLKSVRVPNPMCLIEDNAFDDTTEVIVSHHSIIYRHRNRVDFKVTADTEYDDSDLINYLDEAIKPYCSDTNHHKLLQDTLGRDDFEEYLDSSYYKDVYKDIKDMTENPETAGELNIDFSVDVNDMSEDTKFFIDEIFAKQFFRAYLDELKLDLVENTSGYISDSQKRSKILYYFRLLNPTDLFDFMVQMGIIDEEVEVDTEDYYKLIQNKLRKDGIL